MGIILIIISAGNKKIIIEWRKEREHFNISNFEN